ncbi:hypothetical protein F383_29672 [Gossypium arboreum]|uniref:Uncharacterized protein n=1 Tax=Gossypium arboreum TaxID=29729 RepID=A0A0B0PG73_GOSAR|nr:hypothetical protein F383_29672 [Gossypium arboreum]
MFCIYSMEIKCCKFPAFKIIYGQH